MSSSTAAPTPPSVGARRRLKLLLAVMVIFMSWAVYTLFAQFGQISSRHDQLRQMNGKLTDAQKKSAALQDQINKLNDPEYIGQIARKEQGMGLPGEKPIHIEKSNP
jgi:cell division protein DivIC